MKMKWHLVRLSKTYTCKLIRIKMEKEKEKEIHYLLNHKTCKDFSNEVE